MSGQAGIYYFDQRPIDRALARRLGEGLAEQGPDGGSEHFGPGLLMVYRAFNFDPLSRSERQPYQSAKGNWITFDGRLDNRDDLVLLAGDYLREDKTDVALALAAYEKWGEPGLNRLLGDWSVAIWDAEKRSIVLASDYMGVRPLFYFANNNFIAWSSDLRLMAAWMDVEEKLDNYYIAAFLQGRPQCSRTIYDGIEFMPCGCSIRAEPGEIRKTRFWKLPVEGNIRYCSSEDYAEHMLHLFREAVLSRLRTDGVVCCDLSGGLDSSSIICMAHHLIQTGAASPRNLISFSYMNPAQDDAHYIPIIEDYCDIEGIHLDLRTDLALDLPAGPMPGAGRNELNKQNALRARGSRASLTGLGGDQVMGNVMDDTDQLAGYVHRHDWRGFFKTTYAWSRAAKIPIWRVLKQAMIPFFPNHLQEHLWREKAEASVQYGYPPKTSCLSEEFLIRYGSMDVSVEASEYHLATPEQRNFVRSIERAQYGHTFRLRDPCLGIKATHVYYHRPLVEFVARVPRRELCHPGHPRLLMRKAFAGFLPSEVLNRKSKAVGGGGDLWCQGLASMLQNESQQLIVEQRGYALGNQLRQMLTNLQVPSNRRIEVFALLALEVWFRTRHPYIIPDGILINFRDRSTECAERV